MGKAGRALKQVLEAHSIPQNQLAVEMEISRSNIHRWINEIGDPLGDNILEIRDALQKNNSAAENEFKRLFWEKRLKGEDAITTLRRLLRLLPHPEF